MNREDTEIEIESELESKSGIKIKSQIWQIKQERERPIDIKGNIYRNINRYIEKGRQHDRYIETDRETSRGRARKSQVDQCMNRQCN